MFSIPRSESNTTTINLLPVELLSEIFLAGNSGSAANRPRILNNPLPSKLLQMCKHWNHVALHTPRLWNDFVIHLLHENSSQSPSLASLWIQRSYPLPLTILAAVDPDDDNDEFKRPFKPGEKASLDALIQVLCGTSSRWGNILVNLTPEQMPRMLRAAQGGPESRSLLHLKIIGVESEMPAPHFELELPDIPCLTLEVGSATLQTNINLPSLRELTIFFLDAGSCIRLVALCPNLEKLNLGFSRDQFDYNCEPVIAKKVSSMSFMFINYHGSIGVFQKITAPSLTTLCVVECNDPFYTRMIAVKDFIIRSKCALQQFHFLGYENCSDQLGTISEICKLSPTLQNLDVQVTNATRSELREFVLGFVDPQFFPLLRNFAFELRKTCDWPTRQALKAFAETRSPSAGGKLKKVYLTTKFHGIDTEIPLEGLEVTGVEICTAVFFNFEWKGLICLFSKNLHRKMPQ